DLARRYLRGVAADVWREVPALTRLELRLLQNGMIEEIERVLDVRRATGEPVRVRPRGGPRRRCIADYPPRDDLRLPRPCHAVTGAGGPPASGGRCTPAPGWSCGCCRTA